MKVSGVSRELLALTQQKIVDDENEQIAVAAVAERNLLELDQRLVRLYPQKTRVRSIKKQVPHMLITARACPPISRATV